MSPCPICERGEPLGVLANRAVTWITAEQDRHDYLCVVAKRHVEEIFELDLDERRAFWDDVTLASEHLANLVRPDKLNIELHGNTIRHLHAHVFARKPTVDVPLDGLRQAFA